MVMNVFLKKKKMMMNACVRIYCDEKEKVIFFLMMRSENEKNGSGKKRISLCQT
jgi:hypothetical protein